MEKSNPSPARMRVVEAMEQGLPWHEAASRAGFQISQALVYRLRRRMRHGGEQALQSDTGTIRLSAGIHRLCFRRNVAKAAERKGNHVKLSFMKETVSKTIWKSTATSYGLTLVAGLPFPYTICTSIRCVQEQLDLLAPGGFTWYECHYLHTTVVAPLR